MVMMTVKVSFVFIDIISALANICMQMSIVYFSWGFLVSHLLRRLRADWHQTWLFVWDLLCSSLTELILYYIVASHLQRGSADTMA